MEYALKQRRFSLRRDGLWLVTWLLAIMGVVFACPPSALSQSTTVVAVAPAELTLEVGESGKVMVNVEDADEFYAFEILLHYDPAVAQVLDADDNSPNIQVQTGDMIDEAQGFLVRNEADNQSGEILYAFTLLAPAPPMSGSGSLIEFELEGVADGSSTLSMEALLATPDGVALPIDLNDGLVTVGAGGPLQPTRTPTTGALASPTTEPTTVSTSTAPAPATQIPSPTAAGGIVLTSTPSETPSADGPTSTITSPDSTSTPHPLTPTETAQSQEPTTTLDIITISPNSIGGTEVPAQTPSSTQQAAEVTEQADQMMSTLKSLGSLLLVGIIILVIALFVAALYLYRKFRNDN